MISVIAQRAPADSPGPDISDPLLTSEAVAVERGRNEIDRNFSPREIVSGSGPLRSFVRPGALAEVMDFERGPWRGKVTSCSLTVTRQEADFNADCNLTLERLA
jgi:hypothetical protein